MIVSFLWDKSPFVSRHITLNADKKQIADQKIKIVIFTF